MNFDHIATYYRWFEYIAFGHSLERRRLTFLDRMKDSRRALVIGDGDGRFTAALAIRNHTVQIDSIERSSQMLRLARRRLRREQIMNRDRIRLIQGDIRFVTLPTGEYDLIATHFFLDVLNHHDLRLVVQRVVSAASRPCHWAVSEFDIPQHGWRHIHAEAWVKTMYFFFRCVAGLKVAELPEWRTAFLDHGFVCLHSEAAGAGLMRSELWQLEPDAASVVGHARERSSVLNQVGARAIGVWNTM
jgi:ubiquinone/menaquinone biosynthesis C-methylase UbiE